MSKIHLHKNQSGLVSFFVVTIIMLVLTLIVLAFAQLVRREQRQTLDRQLNTQAFYAAESGVNDAIDRLNANPALANEEYDECTGPDSFMQRAGLTNILNPEGPISYSCLLVDPSPTELDYSSVPTNESVALPIRSQDPGNPIQTLEVSWEDSSGGNNISNCPPRTQYPGRWNTDGRCEVGMLRLELVPFAGATSRDQLVTNRVIVYLQPEDSDTRGGDPDFTFAQASVDRQGGQHLAVCDGSGPRLCSVDIDLRATMCGDAANPACHWPGGYLRMRSMYRGGAVTIRAFAGSSQLELAGAQVAIDATGKANDVLRRIKVNAPVNDGIESFPEFALQSARTQCKRFVVAPPSTLQFGVFLNATSGPADPCNPAQVTDPALP